MQVQLPLLICGLFCVMLVGMVAWAYSVARKSILDAADVKLATAVDELGRLAGLGLQPLFDFVHESAEDPAVAAALADPTEEALAAARPALERLCEINRQSHVIELWNADGERILRVAGKDPGDVVSVERFPAPPEIGFLPITSSGGRTLRTYVHEVRDANGEPIGRIAIRTQVKSDPNLPRLLKSLVGSDATILYGNRDDPTWTDGDGPVPGPAVDPLAPGRRVHVGHDGRLKLGRGTALAGTPWVMWIEVDAEQVLGPARELLRMTSLVAVGLLVLGVAGAWLIGRRVSGPLARATRAASDVAAGRYDEPLAVGGPDEIAGLAQAFNRMAGKVQARTEELEAVRDRYRGLYDGSPDVFLSVSGDRRIVQCNATAARRLGLTKDEILARKLDDLCEPSSCDAVIRICEEAERDGSVENARVTLLDSARRRVPVLLSAVGVRGRSGGIAEVRMALRDVSDVEQAESRRASVVHDAMDGIITIDGDGRIVEFNPAAAEMFGYQADEATGRKLSDLIIPEPLRAEHERGLQRFRETGEGPVLGRRIELTARHKDGAEFPVELAIVQLESADALLFTGFVRDLSHLKRAQRELERTIADLRRSNDDLEQFAYVASHDLQEPLRMVTLFMEMLGTEYADKLEGDAQRYVQYAVEGAERLRRLVDGLLHFSRIGTRGRSLRPCDCDAALGDAVSNLALRIEETGATVEAEVLPVVWADPAQLQQVFQNLLSNALKFRGPKAPRITVRARRDGDFHEIQVEDNGIGFEPGQEARIFQMFQRLHERQKYEGSGIGLAIAKRIVERHGGRMWATSTPGKGACFHFTMPIARPDPHPDAPFPARSTEEHPIGASS